MKTLNQIPFLFSITLLVGNICFSQSTLTNLEVSGLVKTVMNKTNNSIQWAYFAENSNYSKTDIPNLCNKLFSSRQEDSWSIIRVDSDDLGFTHERYQQYYKDIEIEGGVYIFHLKNDVLSSANGDFMPNLNIEVSPWINGNQAMNFAMDNITASLTLHDLEQTSSELLITWINSKPVLAYKCQILARNPHVNKSIYVSASTGKFLKEINHICSANVVGVAQTQFSGTQNITTNSTSPTNFQLQQTASGGGIVTLRASNVQTYTDSDNNWNNINAAQDEFATDVHFGAESTYNFYFTNFARNSFDNLGTTITSYANDPSVEVNAYWSGGLENAMYYGNGDADYFPVASLDVAGHELTHGVTEYSASLIYADESGALNESFSDIFGNTIRFLYGPSFATWYIGDQLLRPGGSGDFAFRNMANPNEFQNADTYGGIFFSNGYNVHYDSGIQNFWYYLLVEGGTGTNDNGDNYAVTGIGMNDAMRIAYRNLTVYLTPSSNFADARDGAEQAAIDLFGLCSPQHFEVIHAWYAVGVGNNNISGLLDADFTQSTNFACAPPLNINFTSNPGYQNYAWNFGDGVTSAIPNPSHSYNTTGNFNVTLTVSNTTLCPDQDIELINNAVVINAINPVAAFSTSGLGAEQFPILFSDASLYGPTSWQWNFGDGGTSILQNPSHTYSSSGTYTITLIVQNCAGSSTLVSSIMVSQNLKMCLNSSTLATSGVIFDSGGQTGDYQDFESCSFLISPCNASSITLTFPYVSLENGYDYLYVYQGTSDFAPLVNMISGNSAASCTVNSGNVFLKFESNESVTQGGFIVSYASIGLTNANFTINPTNPNAGQSAQFNDLSQSNPTSWLWNFGDGTTSILQNPTHSFAQNGIYTVTLTSSFCGLVTNVKTTNVVVGDGVGLEELSGGMNQLVIAPNPATSSIQIFSVSEITKLGYSLIDLSGREIEVGDFNSFEQNNITITPNNISAGHYILELVYESNNNIFIERHRVEFIN